jgi:hypothetical protein
MINTRYIILKVDNYPKIVHLLSCRLCPLLYYDKRIGMILCQRFTSESDNVIASKKYSCISVKDVTIPFDNIEIPNWCSLPSDIKDIGQETEVYYKTANNKYEKSPLPIASLIVVSSINLSYSYELITLVSNANNRTLFPALNIIKENTVINDNSPIIRKCSCCGIAKEKVQRTEHNGMCSECWEANKDDKEVMRLAFINNFRLKRKATWSNEKFKTIIIE